LFAYGYLTPFAALAIYGLLGWWAEKKYPRWSEEFTFPVASGWIAGESLMGVGLVLLAFAILALYAFRLGGAWRWIYVASASAALYLNCFVGVVQAFQKVSFLNALAPTQAEPPFAIAQVGVLAIFVLLGVLALRNFHPAARHAALRS